MNNLNIDSKAAIADIAHLFRGRMQEQGSLTASFKNTWQIMDSLMAGTHTITVPADLRPPMFFNPAIENAVQAFRNNWFSTYGDKRTYELKIDR